MVGSLEFSFSLEIPKPEGDLDKNFNLSALIDFGKKGSFGKGVFSEKYIF